MHGKLFFILLIILIMAGCSGVQLPAFGIPTATAIVETPMNSPEPTITLIDTPSPTLTPTFTLTPSPTVFLTATDTPKNFVLANSGYDIADVRLSYPREDIMVIDFKYRLDERVDLEKRYADISLNMPKRCLDDYYSPYFRVKELVGTGRFTFKMTLKGTCSADTLEFSITVLPENLFNLPGGGYSYHETVLQPYKLTRTFPTVNSNTISMKHFNFEPKDNWSGTLTFDYNISEDIPIPPEEYHFELYSSGVAGECGFRVAGLPITEHSGVYQLEINLVSQVSDRFDKSCLDKYKHYTYSVNSLFLEDDLASHNVYRRDLNFTYRIWKHY